MQVPFTPFRNPPEADWRAIQRTAGRAVLRGFCVGLRTRFIDEAELDRAIEYWRTETCSEDPALAARTTFLKYCGDEVERRLVVAINENDGDTFESEAALDAAIQAALDPENKS